MLGDGKVDRDMWGGGLVNWLIAGKRWWSLSESVMMRGVSWVRVHRG
jgi:hypothetical protein